MFELEVLYYLAYALFAILGLVRDKLYFAFHFTEIAFRYPGMKKVGDSII